MKLFYIFSVCCIFIIKASKIKKLVITAEIQYINYELFFVIIYLFECVGNFYTFLLF